MITDEHWNDFARDGYLHLGPVVDSQTLEALRRRADDLAMGTVENPGIQLQLDTGGAYEALPGAVRRFAEGTRMYRKIQGLETDDLFAELMRHPLFVEVCANAYGPHAPISIFRAMVMNKPAEQGTVLPWHQDGGTVWELDRDPLVTIWTALDPATTENGCLEVIPGSHRRGLLSWFGSTVSAENVERYCLPDAITPLPVPAGHAVLLHNWLLHRSGTNPSPAPRRAFTCCYLDGRTRNNLTGELLYRVWGELPGETPAYLDHLRGENHELRQGRESAIEYALSLQAANADLQASIAEATAYARSLEAALAGSAPAQNADAVNSGGR